MRMLLCPKSQHPWPGQAWVGGTLRRLHGERSKGLREEKRWSHQNLKSSESVPLLASACLSASLPYSGFLFRVSVYHLQFCVPTTLCPCLSGSLPPSPSFCVSVTVSEALPSFCPAPGIPVCILLHSRTPPATNAKTRKTPMTIPTTGMEDPAGDSVARGNAVRCRMDPSPHLSQMGVLSPSQFQGSQHQVLGHGCGQRKGQSAGGVGPGRMPPDIRTSHSKSGLSHPGQGACSSRKVVGVRMWSRGARTEQKV